MNNVVTVQKLKSDWLQIRIREEVKGDFAIAAELRGASMSGLVLQFIMKTIREEKALSPESFVKTERKPNDSNVQPTEHVVYVPSLGELTDERKQQEQKSIKRKVAK